MFWLLSLVLLTGLVSGMNLPNGNENLILACINGNVRKVRQQLSQPTPCTPTQQIITRARIIRALEPYSSFAGGFMDCPLCVATICNKPAVVKVLMTSREFYGSPAKFNALILAARLGYRMICAILLRKHSTYPAYTLNTALVQACTYGHIDTTALLLGIDRVDPSYQNNSALIAACSNGYFSVANLLINDPRVDPSCPDNEPLIAAVSNRSFKIVAALLYSGKVDPSWKDGYALLLATRLEDERTIRVLLRDARLYPFIDLILGEYFEKLNFSPEIAALLYAHTPSTHIFGSPGQRRLVNHLYLCKASTFVLHNNHFYSYEVLEQLLRCEMSLGHNGPFGLILLNKILETNGVWTNQQLHETLNFVVSRCSTRWLRIILDYFATRLDEYQMNNFIKYQKTNMNLELAELLMIAPAYMEVSVLFTKFGAKDLLPLLLRHQLASHR